MVAAGKRTRYRRPWQVLTLIFYIIVQINEFITFIIFARHIETVLDNFSLINKKSLKLFSVFRELIEAFSTKKPKKYNQFDLDTN